ncbi:hypothetical protein D3C75_668640 [compost metagenome]
MLTGGSEKFEGIGLARPRRQGQAAVGQVSAAGAFDHIGMDIIDRKAFDPAALIASPFTAGMLLNAPVIHILKACAGCAVGDKQERRANAAGPLCGNIRAVIADKRLGHHPCFINLLIASSGPEFIEGERQAKVADFQGLCAGVGHLNLPEQVIAYKRIAFIYPEIADSLGIR